MTPEQELETIKNILKHNFPNEWAYHQSRYEQIEQDQEVQDGI